MDGVIEGDSNGQSSETTAESHTGTTIVGLTATEGVVMASDRRASLGGMVSSKGMRKVVPVADRAAVAFSGSVSGAQALTQQLETQVRLYELRRNEPMTMQALSTLTANLLRGEQFGVMPLLGGVDAAGGHLYEFDPAGGMTENEYAAGGSGMPYAYGLLESTHEPGLTMTDARELAARAVDVASERDLASGNGLVLVDVTADGVTIEEFDRPSAAA